MSLDGNNKKVISHSLAFGFSVGITVLSGQNPRVLLYAQAISLLYRFISIWLLSVVCNASASRRPLVARLSREPEIREQSRPWRDGRTGGLAGIWIYSVVILTVIFMLAVLFEMSGGMSGNHASLEVIQELAWASLVAFAYWIDDLVSRQIVLDPGNSVEKNLGYNVSGLNFLTAAIFISALIILLVLNVGAFFLKSWPDDLSVALTWLVFLVLSLVRFAADSFDLVRKKDRQSR